MKLASTLAAIAFATFSAVAHAQSVEVATIQVPYGDLNLSSQAGAQAMLSRLEAAASKVCGDRPTMREVGQNARYRACVHQAMAAAVAELNAVTVSRLFAATMQNRDANETSISQR